MYRCIYFVRNFVAEVSLEERQTLCFVKCPLGNMKIFEVIVKHMQVNLKRVYRYKDFRIQLEQWSILPVFLNKGLAMAKSPHIVLTQADFVVIVAKQYLEIYCILRRGRSLYLQRRKRGKGAAVGVYQLLAHVGNCTSDWRDR